MALRVGGSCSACGQCCRTVGLPIAGLRVNAAARTVSTPVEGASEDWLAFLRARGAAIREGWATLPYRTDVPNPIVPVAYGPRGVALALVKHVCPQLTEDNGCRLHGTPEKPAVCARYPTPLDDLSVVPDCTHSITDD